MKRALVLAGVTIICVLAYDAHLAWLSDQYDKPLKVVLKTENPPSLGVVEPVAFCLPFAVLLWTAWPLARRGVIGFVATMVASMATLFFILLFAFINSGLRHSAIQF